MNKSKIVHTCLKDIDFIFEMLEAAIKYQRQNGYPVWPLFERSALENTINQGQHYKLLIDRQIACVFKVLLEDKVVWRDLDQANAIYLHGVIVNPAFKGQRLFGSILEWSRAFAKERELEYVRLDTWGDNTNIISYYKSFGFEFVEYFTTPDTLDLPLQQRGNKVILLELPLY